MTGGPGLDREDSSSNRRWRATPGRWKRAFAGIIKDGGEQVVRVSPGVVSVPPVRVDQDSDLASGLDRPSQPGPGLASGSLPPPTRRRPTRADSVAGARARLAWPCLGSPRVGVRRLRPGPGSVLGNGRLPIVPCRATCPASASPPTRRRPSRPSLMRAWSRVARVGPGLALTIACIARIDPRGAGTRFCLAGQTKSGGWPGGRDPGEALPARARPGAPGGAGRPPADSAFRGGPRILSEIVDD